MIMISVADLHAADQLINLPHKSVLAELGVFPILLR